MNEKVGSIVRIDDRDVQFVFRVDRLPVRHGSAAQRIDAQLEAGAANRVHVDRRSADRGRKAGRNPPGACVAALIAVANGTRFTPALFPRSSSLARFSTHCVTSVSAGPPFGRVVLEAAILAADCATA